MAAPHTTTQRNGVGQVTGRKDGSTVSNQHFAPFIVVAVQQPLRAPALKRIAPVHGPPVRAVPEVSGRKEGDREIRWRERRGECHGTIRQKGAKKVLQFRDH